MIFMCFFLKEITADNFMGYSWGCNSLKLVLEIFVCVLKRPEDMKKLMISDFDWDIMV